MRLCFDLETNGLLDVVNTVHCIEAQDVDTGETFSYGPDQIEEGLAKLAEADLLIGHNIIGYDFPALRLVYPEWTHKALVRDTLVISRLIWTNIEQSDYARWRAGSLPGQLIGRFSLEAWGYRMKVMKDDFGKTTDWQKWTPEMQTYCKQDVEVNTQLWKRIAEKNYSEAATQLEIDFTEIMTVQEHRGWTFDKPAAVDLYARLSKARDGIAKELQDIFPPREVTMKTPAYFYFTEGDEDRCNSKTEAHNYARERAKVLGTTIKVQRALIAPGPMKVKRIPFKASSRDEIARRLIEKYTWSPDAFGKDGKPSVTEDILKALPYPECPKLIEALTIDKRIGMLAEGKNAWLKLEEDGVIHGRVISCGTGSHRCSHIRPNVSQVPAVYSPYGKDCRSLFVARPGMSIVGADASGLQLRTLSHFLAPIDGGRYIKEILEGDIHTANQEAAGISTRDKAKTFIYAFLFGAGDGLLGGIEGGTRKDGAKLRKRFLTRMPAVKTLDDRIRATIMKSKTSKQWGRLKGIDGRYIYVPSPRVGICYLQQLTEAVIMKTATVMLWEFIREGGLAPYAFPLAHVHDEYQLEVAHGYEEQVGQWMVQAIIEAGTQLGIRCPLDGEYKIGTNWAETH